MSKKKDAFIFKKSWADALKKRSTAVQLEVYNAIVSYAVDGIIPQMSEIAEVVFDFIRIEIDENNAKYEEVIKKRRAAGKKGMNSRYGKEEELMPMQPVEEEEDNNKPNKDNKQEQDVTKLTHVNKANTCCQMVTNITDNVSDSVSVNILTDIKKETISNEIVKKEAELLSPSLVVDAEIVEQDGCDDFDLLDESIVVPVSKSCRVDYARVVNLFHRICVEEVRMRGEEPLSSIQKLTEDRKSKVRSRLKEMEYDYGKLENVFRSIVDSDFLMGKNDRRWAADFDWIFQNKSNWLKVLEGRYQNRDARQDNSKSQLATNVGFLQRAGVKQEDVIF